MSKIKKGFERKYPIIPQTQDRTATLHQTGEVYAGDCGYMIQQFNLAVTDNQASEQH